MKYCIYVAFDSMISKTVFREVSMKNLQETDRFWIRLVGKMSGSQSKKYSDLIWVLFLTDSCQFRTETKKSTYRICSREEFKPKALRKIQSLREE